MFPKQAIIKEQPIDFGAVYTIRELFGNNADKLFLRIIAKLMYISLGFQRKASAAIKMKIWIPDFFILLNFKRKCE